MLELGGTARATRLRYRTIAIEDLVARGGGEMGDGRTGDGAAQFVLSRDQHDPAGELVRSRISRTYRRTAYALQVLTVVDDAGAEQTLRVTAEHPFFTPPGGWTPAKSLRPGDRLAGVADGLTVRSNTAEPHPAGVTVYNLEVEQSHTYFVLAEHARDAEAVWVHNADGSYTNFHASGKTYSGKGDIVRAGRSANRIAKLGDPLIAQDWTPAANATDLLCLDPCSGERDVVDDCSQQHL